MDEPETVFRADGLGLAYGRRAVLEEANLEIRRGEFWLFIGPNGSGKTTLMRVLLGVLSPRAGVLTRHAELGRPERMGFVPQRCDLNPSLPTTVREFVLLGRTGLPRSAAAAEGGDLAWALERVGLGGMARRSYWALSGGQRQRALLARALVRRPAVLALDEPTSGLDRPAQESLLRALDDLHRAQRLTILFVTHDLSLAARYGTHVALFTPPRLMAGPRDAILTPENLERAYGAPVAAVGPGGD